MTRKKSQKKSAQSSRGNLIRLTEAELSGLIEQKAEKLLPHLVKQSVTHFRVEHREWEGPLPPPDMAETYERLQPGFTDRSLAIAEKAQDAEIKMIARRDWHSTGYSFATLFCTTLVILVIAGFGLYLLLNDKMVEGLVALATVLAPVMIAAWRQKE